jgi:hypothetical protein
VKDQPWNAFSGISNKTYTWKFKDKWSHWREMTEEFQATEINVGTVLKGVRKPFVSACCCHSTWRNSIVGTLINDEVIKDNYNKDETNPIIGSRGSSVITMFDYGLDDRAIEVRSPAETRGFFPLTSLSRPDLRHTQPPVQWVPAVLSRRVKHGRSVTLITHPHLVPRSWMSRSCTSSPSPASP